MSGLNLAFAGTPELAAVVLAKLIDHPTHCVKRVLTQPDRPAGRGKKIRISPVKKLALEHKLELEQPTINSNIDPQGVLKDYDALIVVAYGHKLEKEIFNRPSLGTFNIHTSLLPKWRGAAPIQRAIEAGDIETGISIMQIDEGLDTGPILLQKKCSILPDDTSGVLHNRLAHLGADAIIEALDLLANNKIIAQPQNNEFASHANKLNKQEALINWKRPAKELERMIRAFNPSPVAFCKLAGYEMRIWQAKLISEQDSIATAGAILSYDRRGIDVACGTGVLRITSLQIPGKKTMSAEQFLNGQPKFKQ